MFLGLWGHLYSILWNNIVRNADIVVHKTLWYSWNFGFETSCQHFKATFIGFLSVITWCVWDKQRTTYTQARLSKKRKCTPNYFLPSFSKIFFSLILINQLNNPLLLNYIYSVGCHALDIHTHFATHAKWVAPQYSLMADCMNLISLLWILMVDNSFNGSKI